MTSVGFPTPSRAAEATGVGLGIFKPPWPGRLCLFLLSLPGITERFWSQPSRSSGLCSSQPRCWQGTALPPLSQRGVLSKYPNLCSKLLPTPGYFGGGEGAGVLSIIATNPDNNSNTMAERC